MFNGASSIQGVVYQDIPALTAGAPTNWLATQAPGMYLYGALIQADIYTSDDMRRALEIAGRPKTSEYSQGIHFCSPHWMLLGPNGGPVVPGDAAHALINEHLRRWLAENLVSVMCMSTGKWKVVRRPGEWLSCVGWVQTYRDSDSYATYEQALVAAVLAQGAKP
jgi:hypothetical protein